MTNTKVPAQLVTDALEQVHSGARVRTDYSGRAMYGSTCFGITFEEGVSAAFSFFAALGELIGADQENDEPDYESDLAWSLARAARTDSMGRSSTIVYFPGYTLEGELPLDEDEYSDF